MILGEKLWWVVLGWVSECCGIVSVRMGAVVVRNVHGRFSSDTSVKKCSHFAPKGL
jgi:hypothetical protein